MDSIAAERGIVAEVELHWGGGRALKQADAAPSTVTVDCLRQTIQHLAAKLKDAERKRDQWEAEYDARRAEVDAVRQALIGLTIPRPDATAEIAALRESLSLSEKAHLDTKKERNQFREALRVERAACDRAAGLIDDDESESRRQWRREYDARRAGETK